MTSIALTSRLEVIVCANCGIEFAAPETWVDRRREHHDNFHCPNGHAQHFPQESEAERYKRLHKNTQDMLTRERAEHDQTRASLTATKGVVTKMRKRAIAGVCQFCHRNFSNVARHVASQHPKETADA